MRERGSSAQWSPPWICSTRFVQDVLALVEPIRLDAFARIFELGLVEADIARDRHPIADVVMQQIEPFVEAPLVEQLGLGAEEALDLGLEQQPIERAVAVT